MLAVSEAVDHVREATGGDVHLAGYSQGGMFCYQAAAYPARRGLASLVTFGSPVDTRHGVPFGLPERWPPRRLGCSPSGFAAGRFRRGRADGLSAARPGQVDAPRIDFILQLHDREALLPRERQRRFLEADGWVAWPGPAMADFLRQFVAHNRMLEGGFVIEDRLVTLADIAAPILSVVGTVDQIAPAAGRARGPPGGAAGRGVRAGARAGHFGLVVGSTAATRSWPAVAGWVHWRSGEGSAPPRESLRCPTSRGCFRRAA